MMSNRPIGFVFLALATVVASCCCFWRDGGLLVFPPLVLARAAHAYSRTLTPRHRRRGGLLRTPRALQQQSTEEEGCTGGVYHPPPVARRNESSVCWVGNYTDPPLRQGVDSTEPLVDPPVALPDPYGWMRDDDRTNVEVLDHLKRENEYTDNMTSHLDGLRQDLYDEMVAKIQETDYTVPRLRGDEWAYYTRTFEGKDHPVHCRAPQPEGSGDGEEEYLLLTEDAIAWDGTAESPILPGENCYLDENALAENQSHSDVRDVRISPSDKYVAYTWDNVGDEVYRLFIKDIERDVIVRDYGEALEVSGGDVLWGDDDGTLFYAKMDEELRVDSVYFRNTTLLSNETLPEGVDAGNDLEGEGEEETLLFKESDQLFWVWPEKSKDGRFLFVYSVSPETSEVWALDLDLLRDEEEGALEMKLVAGRRTGILYDVEHHVGNWLIVTNANLNDTSQDSTPNMRLATSPAVANSSELWTDLVGPDGVTPLFDGRAGDRDLGSVEPLLNYLLLEGREGGLPRIWIATLPPATPPSLETNASASVESREAEYQPITVEDFSQLSFEEEAYTASVAGTSGFNSTRIKVQYESLVTPPAVISIDLTDTEGPRTVLKAKNVVGYEKGLYDTFRTTVLSRDAETQIPVDLVYRVDLVGDLKEGSGRGDLDLPTHMDGYGSYGYSMEAEFQTKVLSLLDRGVVFVVTHVRGGGEMGFQWYEGAKYLTKKNTFNDFVDIARWLVGQDGDGAGKITTPEKLSLEGRSAGGLLVGASINQAPELFRAALAVVPFVDITCTMSDASIPLTVTEWEEWGNPNEIKYFDYINSYSPMNNVKDGAVYPATLITGGLHDPRVQYWEPAKFTAELRHRTRANTTDDRELTEGMNDRPILLKMDMTTGHFSVGRYKYIEDTAFEYAFLLDQLGVCSSPAVAEARTTSTSQASAKYAQSLSVAVAAFAGFVAIVM